jgi:hypothetical protein
MNWPLFLSVVLVAPVVAHSQQPSDAAADKSRSLTLRACVQQGTHGSPGNLHQIEVIAPGSVVGGPQRVVYWFFKNVDGFKDHPGHLVEITGTVAEVIKGAPELKATDGVFAEIQLPTSGAAPAAKPVGSDVAVAGNQAEKAVATSGSAAATDEVPTTVLKAAVSSLKMLGSCR